MCVLQKDSQKFLCEGIGRLDGCAENVIITSSIFVLLEYEELIRVCLAHQFKQLFSVGEIFASPSMKHHLFGWGHAVILFTWQKVLNRQFLDLKTILANLNPRLFILRLINILLKFWWTTVPRNLWTQWNLFELVFWVSIRNRKVLLIGTVVLSLSSSSLICLGLDLTDFVKRLTLSMDWILVCLHHFESFFRDDVVTRHRSHLEDLALFLIQ